MERKNIHHTIWDNFWKKGYCGVRDSLNGNACYSVKREVMDKLWTTMDNVICESVVRNIQIEQRMERKNVGVKIESTLYGTKDDMRTTMPSFLKNNLSDGVWNKANRIVGISTLNATWFLCVRIVRNHLIGRSTGRE